jgi:hypothetical protein
MIDFFVDVMGPGAKTENLQPCHYTDVRVGVVHIGFSFRKNVPGALLGGGEPDPKARIFFFGWIGSRKSDRTFGTNYRGSDRTFGTKPVINF